MSGKIRVKMASTSAVVPSSAMISPNWLEIPDGLMANIFQRLSSEEILNSTWKVCRSWRRICKDPAMWKVIDISKSVEVYDPNYNREMLTKKAVALSCGEVIDISLGDFCTDDLLLHIVLQSSKLKRLSLCLSPLCFRRMTGRGLTRAVKRLSQLEELEFSYIYIKGKHIEDIGQNCPQLKSLKIFDMMHTRPYVNSNNQAVAIANNMHALRHLQIVGDKMRDTGFQAILNGCPHLQSLDIHMRRSFNVDENLVIRCMERIKDFKNNSTQNSDYYDFDSDSDAMYFSVSDLDESSEADD